MSWSDAAFTCQWRSGSLQCCIHIATRFQRNTHTKIKKRNNQRGNLKSSFSKKNKRFPKQRKVLIIWICSHSAIIQWQVSAFFLNRDFSLTFKIKAHEDTRRRNSTCRRGEPHSETQTDTSHRSHHCETLTWPRAARQNCQASGAATTGATTLRSEREHGVQQTTGA